MKRAAVGLLIAGALCSGCATTSTRQRYNIVPITNPDIHICHDGKSDQIAGPGWPEIIINYAKVSTNAPTTAVLGMTARVGQQHLLSPKPFMIPLPHPEGTFSMREPIQFMTFMMRNLFHAAGEGDIEIALFEARSITTGPEGAIRGRQLSNPVRVRVNAQGTPVSSDANRDAAVTRGRSTPPPIPELKEALIHTLFPKASDKEVSLTDGVQFSPDGKWLMTRVEGYLPKASRYALFATSDGTRCRAFVRLGAQFGCGSAAISPDSATLALLSGEGGDGKGISLYRITNGALVQSITDPVITSWDVVGMPNAQTILLQRAEGSMTSPKSGARISLFDLRSKQFTWSVSTKGPVMAISRDWRYIACATGSPKGGSAHADGYPVQIISTEQPTAVTSFVAHTEWIATLAFAPDSKTLASSGADGVVKLWSVPDGKLLHTFKGHEWTVNAVRFSPDGKTLVSGSKDSTIRFWDIGRLAPIGCIKLSDSPISSMDIDPEGRAIAFGDEKGRVSVCDYMKVKSLASRTDMQGKVSSER